MSAQRAAMGAQRAAIFDYAGESGMVGSVRDEPADLRVSSLDGLRAVALLLVVLHNAGGVEGGSQGLLLKVWVLVSNAGWVGVQLFFALSGFLITRILLDAKGRPGWLRSFYVRRALRIFPLYYAFLFFIFVVVPRVGALPELIGSGTLSQGWYWSYLSNWSAPFGRQPEGLPHVWSLAVEEQFYLLWPLVVATVTDRALARIAIGIVFMAFVARLAIHQLFPEEIAMTATYTWTIARADTIVLGGLIAVVIRDTSALAWLRSHLLAGLSMCGGIIVVVTAVQRGFPSKGLSGILVNQPLSALFSVLLVLLCVSGPTVGSPSGRVEVVVREWLSASWLTTIGKYSYAIYVLHRPVHVLLRAHANATLMRTIGLSRFLAYVGYTLLVFLISFGLARITWMVIEQPFLSLKRYFPMPRRALA